MLADTDIDRFGRQILLPEVGGRGQERLQASRVRLVGRGPAADLVGDLLARAGVGTIGPTVEAPDVAILVEDGVPARGSLAPADGPQVRARVAATAGSVLTIVGRPCSRCAGDVVSLAPPGGAGDDADPAAGVPGLAAAAAHAVGALAAGQVMGVLLGTAASRVQHVDLARGAFSSVRLPDRGCSHCRSDA